MKAKISKLDRLMMAVAFAQANAAEYATSESIWESKKAAIAKHVKKAGQKASRGVLPKIA